VLTWENALLAQFRWRLPASLALFGLLPLLAGLSIEVFPPEWRVAG
jgi:hypothetical protein